ncbi:SH3 domain-containing protein [Streptomyces acidiscabies]|uniref:SH3 domain-containing protein n=1 Tax=Streptomyces acidiscabies TaxID=42234 RepID=A0ABU4LWQ2_9ACTN|nr:SH3 domain-containing protein [Streptomyces acidiscabies]MDX3020143.1 SH3 domain-containing protein [Streptomyces acidiscabies]
MSAHRIAVLAATAAAVAVPLMSAPAATAAPRSVATAVPASSCTSAPYLPWAVHGTTAVTIRSKATTKSTAVGILYASHTFTAHTTTKGAAWVYITDRTTKVTGWVSGTYVYRDIRMCLD